MPMPGTSATRTGPTRSDSRPAYDDSDQPTAEPSRIGTAIACSDQPSSPSRSGPSRFTTAAQNASIDATARPAMTSGCRIERPRSRRSPSVGGSSRPVGAMIVTTVATPPTSAIRLNANDGDVHPPSAPNTGPAIDPAETRPMMPPTISPRRSLGAFAVSHAIDAPQQAEFARPCAARAATSTHDRRRECEGHGGDREEHVAGDHDAAGADPSRQPAGRDGGDQDRHRQRREHQSGLGFRQVELLGVVRQERHQGQVQHRVHEQGDPDGGPDLTHRGSLSAAGCAEPAAGAVASRLPCSP